MLLPVVLDLPFSVTSGLKMGSFEVVFSDDFEPSVTDDSSFVPASTLVDAPAMGEVVSLRSVFGDMARWGLVVDCGERDRDAGDAARDCSEMGDTPRTGNNAGDIALDETERSSSNRFEPLSIKSVDAGRLSLSLGSSTIGEYARFAKADIGFSGCERCADVDGSSFFSSLADSSGFSSDFSFSSAPSASMQIYVNEGKNRQNKKKMNFLSLDRCLSNIPLLTSSTFDTRES